MIKCNNMKFGLIATLDHNCADQDSFMYAYRYFTAVSLPGTRQLTTVSLITGEYLIATVIFCRIASSMTSISWTKGANIPGKGGSIWGRWAQVISSLGMPWHVSECLMMLSLADRLWFGLELG